MSKELYDIESGEAALSAVIDNLLIITDNSLEFRLNYLAKKHFGDEPPLGLSFLFTKPDNTVTGDFSEVVKYIVEKGVDVWLEHKDPAALVAELIAQVKVEFIENEEGVLHA